MINFLQNQKNSNFLEKFEILDYINSGSSGIVYDGFYRREPQKKVCFKFLLNKTSNNNSKNNIKNFHKITEINIQNKIKNRNIIEYYDYIDLNNSGCIIMELAKYGDLECFQRVLNKKRHFSETLLAYLSKQILSGLYYLNQSKIIHMDIKPQNILIDDKLIIKITDFSVSLTYEGCPENGKIFLPLVGTNLYMSPEVLSKKAIDYDDCNKIDLFSFGVVLYNLAFEKFPYELDYSIRKNFRLIFEKIQKEKLVLPEKRNYSILFRKFLAGLLEKNIKKRTSIYTAMEDPWIKGAELLFQEKEKINDLEKFLINMITDNIRSFNNYLQNYKSKNNFKCG